MKIPPTVLALLCLTLGACATPPTGNPATALAAHSGVAASAPAAASASAAAVAAAPGTDTGDPAAAAKSFGERDQLLKRARSSGYKTRQKNGETVYCREETPVGTHFPLTNCLTEEQTLTAMRNAIQTQDFMRNAPGRCAGASCLGN
jgi:hypothetical protein